MNSKNQKNDPSTSFEGRPNAAENTPEENRRRTERNQKNSYRKAFSYCSRFIDRDPSTMKEQHFHNIRLKLRFMRKMENKFPHLRKTESLPIDRIPLSKEASNSKTSTDQPNSMSADVSNGICDSTKGNELIEVNQIKREIVEEPASESRVVTADESKEHTNTKPLTKSIPTQFDAKIIDSSNNQQPMTRQQRNEEKRMRSIEDAGPYISIARALAGIAPGNVIDVAATSSYTTRNSVCFSIPVDLRLAIIDRADPDGRISKDHWLLIEAYVRDIILCDDVEASKTSFGKSTPYKGVQVVQCLSEESWEFLRQTINEMDALWEGADLAAVSISEIPCGIEVTVWVPPPKTDSVELLKLLQKQNRGLRTCSWRVINSYSQKGDSLVFKMIIDQESAQYVKNCDEILNFGSGFARVRFPQ
ncbi:uncharacterized protein isoform X1 [Musca autumnalis]|uniref:uncharacterized protein isoform X1 n=1 Tax=Musca autumnalis TaxID=221902 RepID=UPI003CF93EBD